MCEGRGDKLNDKTDTSKDTRI